MLIDFWGTKKAAYGVQSRWHGLQKAQNNLLPTGHSLGRRRHKMTLTGVNGVLPQEK